MHKALRDLLAGIIFIGFGLAFAVAAYGYGIGTAIRLGPGAFPLMLGGCLVTLGLITVIQGFLADEGQAIGPVPWRAILLVIGGILFFGVTVRGLGLAPALFVAVLLSAFASSRTNPLSALLLALALTAFCALIFVGGLGLPIPLIGPWLNF